MAEPAEQQNTPSPSWRVRACRASWKVLLFVWGTLVIGILVNVGSSWLITKNFDLAGTPLGWGADHLWMMLCILFLLIVLTLLSWLGGHEKRTELVHPLSKRGRRHMLRRLRVRYEQILAQSLQGAVQLELDLAERPTAVQNALSLALRLPDQPEQSLPPRTSIVQAYELAQQELLILGEPGAGKSTLLVELARFLVAEAERDATQPLPILLPLASWAVNRHSLGEWLGEEIARLYHVSRRLSQQCIEAGVLPLLDGLDEMERGARTACIAAINTYHREQLRPLVVCSRATEYDAAARHERLALHTAIIVQPLESKQVDAYLVKLGKPLAGLRAAWKTDTLLQELATTPLMLQVLTLTYHDTSVQAVSQREPQLRKQIWTDYVQRMVRHKGDIKRYPLSVTTGWLRWLASEMRQRNQAIFSLETFQLDWLPQRQRNQYQWSVGLLSGLFHGLYYGLFIGLGVGLALGLLFGLLGGLNVGLRGLLIGLGVGLLNGLIIGLGSGTLSGQFPGQPNELVLRQRAGVVKLDVGLFDAAVQPYLVRFWLARSGVFPWRAVPFLEDATARILLRRVGGRYQFTHRLLLDYFADLDAQA